ncbi:hypothetical protein GYMLUDRAFT_490587 [Collybiopsis luxurians FD-317 M1]|uniref:Uncharacterized protein n=1 Tax=Collybiopsis luxurians FD-317 M1 TaxID=944289 RepID=A0A0D0C3Q1_9AGAR|nr:hypothetical protein GYMLUDRAFT_490587 [Collybiopsis luxurians FD-317 M1]
MDCPRRIRIWMFVKSKLAGYPLSFPSTQRSARHRPFTLTKAMSLLQEALEKLGTKRKVKKDSDIEMTAKLLSSPTFLKLLSPNYEEMLALLITEKSPLGGVDCYVQEKFGTFFDGLPQFCDQMDKRFVQCSMPGQEPLEIDKAAGGGVSPRNEGTE